MSIAYVDLDGFKQVNDEQGHTAGDAVLQVVANELAHSVRASDLVARVGGDEFAVLLPETGAEDAIRVASRLQAGASACDGVTASVGVVTAARPPASLEPLLARADGLMYEAKRRGKGKTAHATASFGDGPTERGADRSERQQPSLAPGEREGA
jgi:diguanylate cyclase (GGDEF)-like protein